MQSLPNYNDKVDPIYPVVFTNIITLGGCSLISLFGFDDIFLSLLFWVQIIIANNSQGYLNKINSYWWRNLDIVWACMIIAYIFIKYIHILPKIVLYPYLFILLVSCYSQSSLFSKSLREYILFVNIWHLLIFYSLIIILVFKHPESFIGDKLSN